MDWLLSNKEDQSSTLDDYQDLMHSTFSKVTRGGEIVGINLISTKAHLNQLGDQDSYIDA